MPSLKKKDLYADQESSEADRESTPQCRIADVKDRRAQPSKNYADTDGAHLAEDATANWVGCEEEFWRESRSSKRKPVANPAGLFDGIDSAARVFTYTSEFVQSSPA